LTPSGQCNKSPGQTCIKKKKKESIAKFFFESKIFQMQLSNHLTRLSNVYMFFNKLSRFVLFVSMNGSANGQ